MKHRCKLIDWGLKMKNERCYGKLSWSVDDKDDYLTFANSKDANLWGMKYYENWAKQYKKIMYTSESVIKESLCSIPIECYCGYSYQQINKFMRDKKDDESNTYRELSDILAIVLASAPRIPQNVVLYRMVSDKFIQTLIEKNRQSTPIKENGFMSTSLIKSIASENESYANEENLLRIFVPKDTIGVYVNAVTERSEEEMLLFPNMYLALIAYPYHDEETGKRVFECKLIEI